MKKVKMKIYDSPKKKTNKEIIKCSEDVIIKKEIVKNINPVKIKHSFLKKKYS